MNRKWAPHSLAFPSSTSYMLWSFSSPPLNRGIFHRLILNHQYLSSRRSLELKPVIFQTQPIHPHSNMQPLNNNNNKSPTRIQNPNTPTPDIDICWHLQHFPSELSRQCHMLGSSHMSPRIFIYFLTLGFPPFTSHITCQFLNCAYRLMFFFPSFFDGVKCQKTRQKLCQKYTTQLMDLV